MITVIYKKGDPTKPMNYRGKIQTTDLMTYIFIAPKRRELGTDMWVAGTDLQKASDSLQHDAFWRSLRNHSICEHYICLLKTLCADQRATFLTDVVSDEFETARGTKQGDLLNCFLFNSVIRSAIEKDMGTWNERGLGIKLGDEKRDCISKLRLADGVLRMSKSLKQLTRMMSDFKT